jgi:hypothetical protein
MALAHRPNRCQFGAGGRGPGAGGPGQSAGGQGQGSRNYFTWFETPPAAKGPKKDPCTRSPKERRRAEQEAARARLSLLKVAKMAA